MDQDFIIHINRQERTQAMEGVEQAVSQVYDNKEQPKEKLAAGVLEAVQNAMARGDRITVPVEIPKEAADKLVSEGTKTGDTVPFPANFQCKIRTLNLKSGAIVYAAFTSPEEADKGQRSSTVTEAIDTYLQKALMNPQVAGILLNPWGQSFFLSKPLIQGIFIKDLPQPGENTVGFATMDITQAETDCIVNAANETLLGGGGVDGAIHRAAGPELLEECRKLNGCPTGQAKLTGGYHLKAKHVIHTVGPVYSGKEEDAVLLRRCYWNSLELARQNGLHSIAFPAISTGAYGYPKEEATRIALKTAFDWMQINPKYGMRILFACFDQETTARYQSTWNGSQEDWKAQAGQQGQADVVERAIRFAAACHSGASRKGTDQPYILHPVATVAALDGMDADFDLLAAGALHDVLEDTQATLLDVYEQFGVDVAALVNAHTEDKRRVWYQRKLQAIAQATDAGLREKKLILADKLANLHSMYNDRRKVGDKLWQRFNAPKAMQAWYYGRLLAALAPMKGHTETANAYQEMNGLVKDLFVNYAMDEGEQHLYQMGADGSRTVLTKGDPQWVPMREDMPQQVRALPRKEAERLEDWWSAPFWKQIDRDLEDGEYGLFASEAGSRAIRLTDDSVVFVGEDRGPASQAAHGKDPYPFRCNLGEEAGRHLLVQLRRKHGLDKDLGELLLEEFGGENSTERFQTFCKEHGMAIRFVAG